MKVSELEDHESLTAWGDVQLANSKKVWKGGRKGMYKLARQVFYHCDIPSLFSRCGELSKHIAELVACMSEEKKKLLKDPLGPFRSCQDVEEAKHAVQSLYAAKHFAALADKEALYACPQTADFESLGDVLLGDIGSTAGGMIDDSADMMCDLAAATTLTSTTQTVFRIVHNNPAIQKVMASPSSSMRQDHMAVALYRVDSFKQTSTAPEMTCSADMAIGAHMSLMSVESFLKMSPADLKQKFFKCIESAETAYSFKPGSLPPHVLLEQANTLARLMVNADAYPGPYAYYAMSKDNCVDTMTALRQQGFVVPLAGSGWQLTVEGMQRLVHSRHVASWDRVFQRRAALPFADMTQWELLDWLLEQQWSLQPLPFRKTVPSLALDKHTDVVGTVYFTANKLELSGIYLRALCENKILANRGHAEIKHRQQVSYYRELLGLPSESKRARKLSIIDDTPDLGGPGSHIKHVDIPAIEDGPAPEPEEGEPDDEDPPATSSRSSLPGSTLDKSQTFSWGISNSRCGSISERRGLDRVGFANVFSMKMQGILLAPIASAASRSTNRKNKMQPLHDLSAGLLLDDVFYTEPSRKTVAMSA